VIFFALFGVAYNRERFTTVFSNREHGQTAGSDAFFDFVHSYQITFICLSSDRYKESYGEGWRTDGHPIDGYNLNGEMHQRVKVIFAT
jgi:hypothetical protein